jgi:hypothetical protein
MAVPFLALVVALSCFACAQSAVSSPHDAAAGGLDGDSSDGPRHDAAVRDSAVDVNVDGETPRPPDATIQLPEPPEAGADAAVDAGELPPPAVEPVLTSPEVGGVGGSAFDDRAQLPSPLAVQSLSLSGGARVDQIAITYRNGTTLSHGGPGGTAVSIVLAEGEVLTSARLCSGAKDNTVRVFHAVFSTSLGRTLQTGVETDVCTDLSAPTGRQIGGFYGRSADEVDALGLLYVPL